MGKLLLFITKQHTYSLLNNKTMRHFKILIATLYMILALVSCIEQENPNHFNEYDKELIEFFNTEYDNNGGDYSLKNIMNTFEVEVSKGNYEYTNEDAKEHHIDFMYEHINGLHPKWFLDEKVLISVHKGGVTGSVNPLNSLTFYVSYRISVGGTDYTDSNFSKLYRSKVTGIENPYIEVKELYEYFISLGYR